MCVRRGDAHSIAAFGKGERLALDRRASRGAAPVAQRRQVGLESRETEKTAMRLDVAISLVE